MIYNESMSYGLYYFPCAMHDEWLGNKFQGFKEAGSPPYTYMYMYRE